MSMYDLNNVPMDSPLWQLVAYCAGTGGSLLVIGSAAGVALMGMEKVGSEKDGGMEACVLVGVGGDACLCFFSGVLGSVWGSRRGS